MISLITVNFNSDEFASLLLESLERYQSEPIELIVIDNSYSPSFRAKRGNIIVNDSADKSHGYGLNLGVQNASKDLCLILDIDCHFLIRGWENAFRSAIEGTPRCLTVAGPPEKPMRPACVFMPMSIAKKLDWRSTPGYQGHRITPEGYDVGIRAYHAMLANGVTMKFMEATRNNRYRTPTGEEYSLDGTPYIYHHWHGTHLGYRQRDYEEDLQLSKDHLFQSIPWRRKAKLL